MPANLPPEYYAAEEDFRAAETQQEKIACLEKLISTVPRHKGTDHLRADLRKRLSKLRQADQQGKAGTRHESVFQIPREGAARVVVTGPPNVGKSALVAAVTKASPEVSAAPFSTWQPTPGMLHVDDIQLQLIDTPPLNTEHMEPELFDLLRSADLLLLMLDLQANPEETLEQALHLLAEHRVPAILDSGEDNAPPPEHGRPALVVVNKTDRGFDEDFHILCDLQPSNYRPVPLSVTENRYIDALKRELVRQLRLIRIYAKPPNKPADMHAPFVLRQGETVADFAAKVHQDFITGLKSARIWGAGVYAGQQVGRDHPLEDGDVVELHL